MSKSGIVNVRMVITEEKILLNIEKVQKMINPNSKKQIVKLEEDTYFKDLIESIKNYLIEYPKKKNFPSDVYKAAYGLVEFATNQFEENTKKIEELIRQREENIVLAGLLKDTIEAIENKDENWKAKVRGIQGRLPEDVIQSLGMLIKCKNKESQTYIDTVKVLNARVGNLESNLHIEIDMERIEDRSKALSYIGIEIADALKTIPAPVECTVKVEKSEEIKEVKQQKVVQKQAEQQYIEETTFEAKPSLWQRVKNCKLIRAIRYVAKIRIVVKYPDALPEGRGENN